MKNIISAMLICVLLLSVANRAEAATDISGHISADTIWIAANSPYVVSADVTIDSGITLTVEPGVVVKFHENTIFLVNGTLKYEVKWKGYPDSENTLEPLDHLRQPAVLRMVRAFDRRSFP